MASEAGTAPALTPATAPNEDTNTATASPPVTDDAKPADSKHREPATNDKPPSVENCRKVENYTVLDRKGDAHPFKSIYEGSDSTPRVLVIFIRHFFCGVSFHFLPFSPSGRNKAQFPCGRPLIRHIRAARNSFAPFRNQFDPTTCSAYQSAPLSP